MKRDGYTWTDEYRAHYFASERVQAHQEEFVAQASRPKPLAQRQKMSLAKTGRKYSQQHKQNMSEAQRFRQSLKKEILAGNPDLDSQAVWQLVRERIESA